MLWMVLQKHKLYLQLLCIFLVSTEVFFHIYLNYLRLNPVLSTSSQFSLQQDEISFEPSN